ncbi:hypothetical protein [Actinomadura madurae]|uniref:hypothetical protein n=1 Tax=Actinomadura madurae TaxID=1993 RepID=UPI003FD7E6BB
MSTRYVSGPNLARLLGDLSGERPVYAALARAVRGLVLDGGSRCGPGCPPSATWPPRSASAAPP